MAFGNKDNLEFLLSVADVLLLDAKTGTQLASATLKSHNMSQTVDTTEIRAGQANDVLATIKNNKTIEVTIEDVQQKHEFIAMMLGSAMQTGATVDAYVLPQGLTVASNKAQLPQTPKEGENVVVTKANGEAIASDKFAGSFKMVLDEQVFNADMQIIARKQTVFYKVIPNDSFTLDGSAERAEKTTSYTFTVALEQGREDLGYVLYVPEGAAE